MKGSASERLIASIQVETFAHATEDPGKVKQAIMNLAPGLDSDVTEETLRGHFDNPILLMRLKLDDRTQIDDVLTVIRAKLDQIQKSVLDRELSAHLDDKASLYIRLDKQELYQGRLVFSEGDDVVKLKFSLAPHLLRKYKPEQVYRLCGLTALS